MSKFDGITAARETIEQSDNPTSETVSQIDSKTASQQVKKPVRKPSNQTGSKRVGEEVSLMDSAKASETARQEALQLANSPWKAVGLKLPAALDDWLTEAAFARRKEGVTKQELLSRALQLLYVELEGVEG